MFTITTPHLALYDAPPTPPSVAAELGMDVDGLSDLDYNGEHDDDDGIDLEDGAEVVVATPGTVITSSALFMRCVSCLPPAARLPELPLHSTPSTLGRPG